MLFIRFVEFVNMGSGPKGFLGGDGNLEDCTKLSVSFSTLLALLYLGLESQNLDESTSLTVELRPWL